MKPNTITRVIDYYLGSEEFAEDVFLAVRHFFDVETIEEIMNLDTSPQAKEWFNEWFVYNYFLKDNKKSVLEDFYERNPHHLAKVELTVYKELQDSVFSMFEVKAVRKEKSLTLRDVQSGKHYLVSEKLGTRSIKPGHLMFGRVAQLGDHWELVGSNPITIPTRIGTNLRKDLKKSKEHFSPKTMYEWYLKRETKEGNNDFPETNNEKVAIPIASKDLPEAERRLRQTLEKYGLDKMVSVETVKQWIYQLENKSSDFTHVTMLTGLANRADTGDEALMEILSSLTDVYQFAPQKRNKGKSPYEMVREDPSRTPDMETERIPLCPSEWHQHSLTAHNHTVKGDHVSALEEYERCFKSFLSQKTTFPEVYRIFANKAVVHFSLGERAHGKRLLEIALELNPNYDFAIDTMKRLESRALESMMNIPMKGLEGFMKKGTASDSVILQSLKEMKRFNEMIDENDPALKYYEYLKGFGINFATDALTTSKITLRHLDGNPVIAKRNDPCPCGKIKEDGTPMKYKKCCGK